MRTLADVKRLVIDRLGIATGVAAKSKSDIWNIWFRKQSVIRNIKCRNDAASRWDFNPGPSVIEQGALTTELLETPWWARVECGSLTETASYGHTAEWWLGTYMYVLGINCIAQGTLTYIKDVSNHLPKWISKSLLSNVTVLCRNGETLFLFYMQSILYICNKLSVFELKYI